LNEVFGHGYGGSYLLPVGEIQHLDKLLKSTTAKIGALRRSSTTSDRRAVRRKPDKYGWIVTL